MQDNYVRIELSWPDITCSTSKLCKGGFIIYKAKDGLGLTDDWVSRFIAPATTAAFVQSLALLYFGPLYGSQCSRVCVP